MQRLSLTLLLFIFFTTINAQTKITEKEVIALAKKVEALANADKWDEIDKKYFDYKAFSSVVSKQLNLSKEEEKSLGLESTLSKEGVLRKLSSDIKNFEFLRVQKINGRFHFLGRIILKNNGINYIHFSVKKDKKLMINDGYSFLINDYFSKSVSDVLMFILPDKENEEKDIAAKAELLNMKKIVAAKNQGDYKKMLKLYSGLKDGQRKLKTFLNLRLYAAQNVSNEEYKKAIDYYYKLYPNEPGLTLMMIDRYLLDDNYDFALQAINKTDSIVGGDVYLETLRASVSTLVDDYETARTSYEAYFKKFPNDPDNAEAYPIYISILVYYDEYVKAIEATKTCKKKFGVDALKEFTEEDYPQFFSSQEYKEYIEGK